MASRPPWFTTVSSLCDPYFPNTLTYFELGYVIGVNVCLLIQLFRTVKPTRLWVTATTLVLFLVVSTFQVLISCVTLIACAGHSGGTSTWFSIQWVARSWLVIRTTAGISTAIQHSFLVRLYLNVSEARQLMVYSCINITLSTLLAGKIPYGYSVFQHFSFLLPSVRSVYHTKSPGCESKVPQVLGPIAWFYLTI